MTKTLKPAAWTRVDEDEEVVDPLDNELVKRITAAQIINTQRRSLGPLVGGLIVTPLLFLIISFQVGDITFTYLTLALLTIGVCRIFATVYIENREHNTCASSIDSKDIYVHFLILFYAIPYGIYSAYGVIFVDNPSLHMVLVASVVVYSGNTVYRNAGLNLAIGSVLFSTQGLMSLALLIHPGLIYKIFGIMAALSILTMRESSRTVRSMILRASEEGARSSQLFAKLEAALNSMSDGIAMFDRRGRIVTSNPIFQTTFALRAAQEAEVMRAPEIAAGAMRAGVLDSDRAKILSESVEAAIHDCKRLEFDLPTLAGKILHLSFQPSRNRAGVLLVTDVTAERERALETLHQATHDRLTDLPNRQNFEDRLTLALRDSRNGERDFALLSLDLDKFKEVNDTLGHPFGDKLLKQVADRLRELVGPTDFLARFGGDEFMILHDAVRPMSYVALAEEAIASLSKPFFVDDKEVLVGVSIGVTKRSDDAQDIYELLRNADLALYAAKAAGRGIFRVYEPSLHERARERREIELELRVALARGQFSLVYQPLVNLLTLQIVGCESLLRWKNPQRGNIPPDRFIPIAEDSRQILEIGRWVLHRACADALTWPIPAKVSVNVSAVQIARDDMVRAVRSALEATGLPPQRLDLEITESTLISDNEATAKVLREWRAMGVSATLDDFGAGYASFSYLSNFRFEKIKLDRSLITKVSTSESDAAIVAAISAYARRLDMEVVAEGVETAQQLAELVKHGVRIGQGYYFSRPQILELIPWRLGCLTEGVAEVARVAR